MAQPTAKIIGGARAQLPIGSLRLCLRLKNYVIQLDCCFKLLSFNAVYDYAFVNQCANEDVWQEECLKAYYYDVFLSFNITSYTECSVRLLVLLQVFIFHNLYCACFMATNAVIQARSQLWGRGARAPPRMVCAPHETAAPVPLNMPINSTNSLVSVSLRVVKLSYNCQLILSSLFCAINEMLTIHDAQSVILFVLLQYNTKHTDRSIGCTNVS